MGHNFYVYFNEDELKELVRNAGSNVKEEVKKFIKQRALEQPRTETLQTKDSIITEYHLLRNEKLRLDIEIKKRELVYHNTFGTEPSPGAKQAIAVGAKNNFEPTRTQPTYQNYSKPITQKDFDATQHCTTFQDRMKGYHAKCNYCEFTTANSRDDAEHAIADIKTHLPQRHYGEVWK